MTNYLFPNSKIPIPDITDSESSLINQLLSNRGIVDKKSADDFLMPNYDSHLHSPELLNNIEEACVRIETAMAEGEQIAIFSDYDSDGIPGAVILHDFFKIIKYEKFQNYIPHRHYEGFGLNKKAIDALKNDGVKLIITIDCGTSNIDEVEYAKTQGVDIIITDHHEPSGILPRAVAVVNPKLGGYPFTHLCGAAVVFKLVQALLARGKYEVKLEWEKWWLDMVGVATIADMVPLVGENRVLAHYGLQVIRKSRRPGLQQLLKKARVDQRYVTEDDIGFTISPRINAASRMDSPEDAFLMLSETDIVKAGEKVSHLEKLNTERKTMVALMTKDIHKRLKVLEEIPSVLVMGSPKWRPSLVGLAASKLAEEYNRPVFLWGTDGNGVYKGSCRSGGGVSVVGLMQMVESVFVEYGGHHFSGGFSVRDEHVFTFGEQLVGAMSKLGETGTIAKGVFVDAEISLEDVNSLLIQQLNKLSPFGIGNPKPIFAFRNVLPQAVELFGKIKEHTKLVFQTENGKLEAIAFFQKPEQFTKVPSVDVPLTMIGHVEQSFFMGHRQLRVRIIDLI